MASRAGKPPGFRIPSTAFAARFRRTIRPAGVRTWASPGLACVVVFVSIGRTAAQTPPSGPRGSPPFEDTVPLLVGLALSGGSAKGFAHVGVLEVLEEAGVQVDVVTGTSMGSVVGGLYATGMTPDSIESLIAGVDWAATLDDAPERRRRFLHQRRFDERTVLSLPVEGGRIGLPAGANMGSNITRLAERATWAAATTRSFEDLPRRFAAVATDIETGEAVTMMDGVLSDVMRASIGIPGVFEPIELDGRVLVDGAVARNLPASDARALGADVVICSDVSDALASRDELGSLVDVLNQVITLSMRRSLTVQRRFCDVLIRPDVDDLGGLDFTEYAEWIDRGREAALDYVRDLEALAARRGTARLPHAAELLSDSVQVTAIRVEGAARGETERLVRDELRVLPGDFVSADELSYRLSELDATGLFGLVRYRLDRDGEETTLAVLVEERARDRVGVGLRYDDERRAALLFSATVHNLIRFGSVSRLDLRVGEETEIRASALRRPGITDRLQAGVSVGWSQGELPVPGTAAATSTIETTQASLSLGLVVARSTFLGGEALIERSTHDVETLPNVTLLSLAAVLDHESLDRIDFPTRGADLRVRWEAGVTDVVDGEDFTVLTGSGRLFVPIHRRITADVGAFVGHGRGLDLPVHRTFFVGGAHRSALFGRTQPLFQGLSSEALVGTTAQIARGGLRFALTRSVFARVGLDVGGVASAWKFPIDDPVVGVAVALGARTLIGPVELEWGKASSRSKSRLTVSVGRSF